MSSNSSGAGSGPGTAGSSLTACRERSSPRPACLSTAGPTTASSDESGTGVRPFRKTPTASAMTGPGRCPSRRGQAVAPRRGRDVRAVVCRPGRRSRDADDRRAPRGEGNPRTGWTPTTPRPRRGLCYNPQPIDGPPPDRFLGRMSWRLLQRGRWLRPRRTSSTPMPTSTSAPRVWEGWALCRAHAGGGEEDVLRLLPAEKGFDVPACAEIQFAPAPEDRRS